MITTTFSNFLVGSSRFVCIFMINLVFVNIHSIASLLNRYFKWTIFKIFEDLIKKTEHKIFERAVVGKNFERIRFHGEIPKGPVLVISNHQSGLDVIIIICLMFKHYGSYKFIMKDSLKWIPGYGWFSYIHNFPFTKRLSVSALKANPKLLDREKNLIESCIQKDTRTQSWICFPEGTRFSDKKKRNFNHVLEPKVGGVQRFIQALGPQVTCLDLTIKYQKADLMRYLFSQSKVDIWAKSFQINSNMSSQEIKGFLLDRWNEKENLLKSKVNDE